VPDLRVRVVNVVDVMRLFPVEHHPHGTTEAKFVELFTPNKPVFFAFGKYQRAIHEMVHGHPDVDRIHVRGFNQQGTITTPFQMVVMNEMSCFPLAAEAIRLVPHPHAGAAGGVRGAHRRGDGVRARALRRPA
jgi:xylulose-5-phosphate/fructose-6-phosphate phosphoketolase